MSDRLAELQRRAYGRSTDEADAESARAELARLAAEGDELEWATPTVPEFRVSGVRALTAVAAAVLMAAGCTALIPTPSPGSLSVFDRPQTAKDLTAPEWAIQFSDENPEWGAERQTIRWLGSYATAQAYGYLSLSGNVCLSIIYDGGAGGACAPPSEFAKNGVAMDTGIANDPMRLSVTWGPEGDVKFYDGTPP